MQAFLVISLAISLASASKQGVISSKKEKRGAAFLGQSGLYGEVYSPLLPLGVLSWNTPGFGATAWNPTLTSDLALGQVQLQATHNVALQALKDPRPGTPSIAYSPDVLRAIQQAKEANHNVLLAQQRVAEAKDATILQQKIALAKEAAAREAAHRSEEISAHALADARASAKQLVALQQRLASLKDAVAAAQRVAAAREAAAAAAIQRNAADTAAELRKQDVDKQITQSEQEAKAKDLVAAKENAIANALHQAAVEKPGFRPWG